VTKEERELHAKMILAHDDWENSHPIDLVVRRCRSWRGTLGWDDRGPQIGFSPFTDGGQRYAALAIQADSGRVTRGSIGGIY
jgi:hypothetical protein